VDNSELCLTRLAYRASGALREGRETRRSERWLESVKLPARPPWWGTTFRTRTTRPSDSLRLTTNALRTIDKKGIDVVLAELRAKGEKI